MIRLEKGPAPQVIVDQGAEWTARWVDFVQNGAEISDTDKSRYRHPDIKAAAIAETFDKCAYCESKVTHTYYGDIEHILPKARRPDLFVSWPNLTLACKVCNTKKGDYYSEALPLLNPYDDDPSEHLRFHGPIVLHVPGSERGEVTVFRLNLARTSLIERRAERIASLKRLIDRWAAAAPGPVKELLLEAIQMELSAEKEYSAALQAFAKDHAGITVPN
jgi:5-methylcytosine-specific restriction endonuclease McrA